MPPELPVAGKPPSIALVFAAPFVYSFRARYCVCFTMSSRWGDEKTIHFIRLYREYECLWNFSSPFYSNKSARDHAYMKIQEDMRLHNVAMTVKDIKNKIKGLRSTYHQELHKIRKANSSPLTCEPYKPTLVWFNEIDFLNDAIEYRKTKSESNSQAIGEIETLEQPLEIEILKQSKKKKLKKTRNSIEEQIEEQGQPQSPHQTTVEIKMEPMEPLELEQMTGTCIEMTIEPVNQPETFHSTSFEANIETLDQSAISSQTTKLQEQPQCSKPKNSNKRLAIIKKTLQNKKKNAPRHPTSMATPLENVSVAMNSRQMNSNDKLKDEFYYFGQSVAAQLRTLPLNNALDMQANIQMLLSTERSRLHHHSTSYEGSNPYGQTTHSEDSPNITPYSSLNYQMVSPSQYLDTSADPLDNANATLQTVPKTETITDETNFD